MMKEPMKMLIFLVALCFLRFCSARHLCFTLGKRQCTLSLFAQTVTKLELTREKKT